MPHYGMPRNTNLYVLDRPVPIRVPKGSDVLVTLTVVNEDGNSEVALQAPLTTFDPNAPLLRRMVASEHDPDEGTD